jgi:hypothetical protein
MSAESFPLRRPDLGRISVIERELAEREPIDEEMKRRVDELQQRYDDAYQRGESAERAGMLHGELAQELEQIRGELAAASSDVLDPATWQLRDEWLQLQVLRGLIPRCFVCSGIVGPVHILVGNPARGLCLDCFDAWADPDVEAMVEDAPASFDVDRLAEQARERESARRRAQAREDGPQLRIVGADEVPQQEDAEDRCWYCGGSAARRPAGGWASTRIALQVAALVPGGTHPELGRLCLGCLVWESGRANWVVLEGDLSDAARRRKIAEEADRRRELEGRE